MATKEKQVIQLKNNQHLGGKVSTAAASDYQIKKSCSFPLVLLVVSNAYLLHELEVPYLYMFRDPNLEAAMIILSLNVNL